MIAHSEEMGRRSAGGWRQTNPIRPAIPGPETRNQKLESRNKSEIRMTQTSKLVCVRVRQTNPILPPARETEHAVAPNKPNFPVLGRKTRIGDGHRSQLRAVRWLGPAKAGLATLATTARMGEGPRAPNKPNFGHGWGPDER